MKAQCIFRSTDGQPLAIDNPRDRIVWAVEFYIDQPYPACVAYLSDEGDSLAMRSILVSEEYRGQCIAIAKSIISAIGERWPDKPLVNAVLYGGGTLLIWWKPADPRFSCRTAKDAAADEWVQRRFKQREARAGAV